MPSVVGQASAAATSVAIPAHNVGDLIIVSARGTAAAPSVPAAGGTVPAWATIQSGLANSIGLTTVAFVATATTTTTGVFTNATHICVLVLRPAASQKLQTSAARSSTGNGNNTQTIIYPALTMNDLDGSSFGVRIGTRVVAITAVGTPPTGWTNQSIQPAGASALMSVHTRAAITTNPVADTVTVTSSNAAYRAHTIEIEEVPVTTDLAASVVGAGSLSAQRDTVKNFAASVVGAAAVLGQQKPPVTFDILIQTNQPYAGEHTVGEFLVGDEDVLQVDLQTIHLDAFDGLIAGKTTLGASLSVTRGLQVDITRAAALVAQANAARGLAAAIAGQASLSADLIRASVVATMVAPVVGQAQVAADMSISSVANYIPFVAAIQGQAALAADLRTGVPAAGLIQGQAQVTVAIGKTVGFGVSVQGQAAVSADRGATKAMAVTIARQAVVSAQSARVIFFDITIATIIPLCGEHLVGTFLVGGASGPHAVITQDFVRTVNYPSTIEGQASLEALLRTSLPFAVEIQGQGSIQANLVRAALALNAAIQGKADLALIFGLRLYLAALIQGQAQVNAKLTYDWLGPTAPGDILLPPTQEVPWILVPTADGSVTLAPSQEEDVVLAATEEEDWLLVPTTERSM
jgi:hypothetical protein